MGACISKGDLLHFQLFLVSNVFLNDLGDKSKLEQEYLTLQSSTTTLQTEIGNLKTRENDLLKQIQQMKHARDTMEMENRKINETVQKQSGIKQEHYVEVERLRQEISKRSKEYESMILQV